VATALANLAGAAMGTADLYAEQARLRAEAEAAVRVRDDVIALASHDLRHPLTAIDGTTQYLQQYLRRARSLDPDQIKRALDRIGESTARMTAMLTDLVDAGRLQAGRSVELQLQPVDLVALVRGIVETQHATTSRHEIRMEASVPELIGQWDPRRLERVVANLFANAIKYSPEGGPIHVRVERSTEGDAPAAVLRFEDRGIGIPADDQPRIFERFYRGANVRGRFEGAGLGLAGVRQIVEQLGGTITVESTEGVGSTFTIRMPLSAHPIQ
jgi:signal transduction histidine kinase